jgi:hypothetical protein
MRLGISSTWDCISIEGGVLCVSFGALRPNDLSIFAPTHLSLISQLDHQI